MALQVLDTAECGDISIHIMGYYGCVITLCPLCLIREVQ